MVYEVDVETVLEEVPKKYGPLLEVEVILDVHFPFKVRHYSRIVYS